ncbi:MAG: hypothetical protein E7255_05955 [Lachnospiraceae bacterium]|jgi:hypothetical protein|nr:hypothetical protein [Lachnospiraceae bacterium]
MEGRAYFFNVSNIDELVQKNQEAEDKGYTSQRYRVLETVQLDDKVFVEFLNNMNCSYAFLDSITSKLKVSKEGEYLCMAVENSHNSIKILVCTFQYSYPKFVAILRRENYEEKVY